MSNISILKVEETNIFFSVNKEYYNVTIIIKDDNFEGVIYQNFFNELKTNITYFISLSSIIIPHLKSPYIEFEGIKFRFNFPYTDLKNYSLIGNSCLCWRTYEKFNVPYNSPTIGNLILDDFEYLRFCEHIESFLSAPITFNITKGNEKFKEITGVRLLNEVDDKVIENYPISHHYDVEIHWIHAKERFITFNDGVYKENFGNIIPYKDFENKWIRRTIRGQNTEKICLWSSSEFFNIHGTWRRKQIVERFKNLPNRSVLLTELKEEEYEDEFHIVKYIPEWEGRHQMERNNVGGTLWNDQLKNAEIMYNIIKQKFL